MGPSRNFPFLLPKSLNKDRYRIRVISTSSSLLPFVLATLPSVNRGLGGTKFPNWLTRSQAVSAAKIFADGSSGTIAKTCSVESDCAMMSALQLDI